jgi:protein gp37
MFRGDERYNRNPNDVHKTSGFKLPIQKDRSGKYKIPSNTTIFTCFTSDFFIEEADEWRKEVYQMMKERSDCHFFLTTKRIDRFAVSLPDDWGEGYPNVTIAVTIENQRQADSRLPIYMDLPIQHKCILLEPLLERVDLRKYRVGSDELVVGGESGPEARPCDYAWVLDLREQAQEKGINFTFKQTGANFIKDGKVYHLERRFHAAQAKKAQIDLFYKRLSYQNEEEI